MELQQALEEVQELIRRECKVDADASVELVLWENDSQHVGIRVTEISVSRKDEGAYIGWSIMACEPLSLGVIAAAERCVIERVAPGDPQRQEEEIGDADWRLHVLLKEQSQVCLVVGNPFDGMKVYGPLPSHEAAQVYVGRKRIQDTWCIVQMEALS